MTAGRWALAALITAVGVFVPAHAARAARNPFAWAPPGTEIVERGRSAANRFGLLSLHEVTIEVDDAFAAANRQALALAEARIAEVAGVRAVYGPAGLLDITTDPRGNTSARPVLGRGGGGSNPGSSNRWRARGRRRASASSGAPTRWAGS